MDGARRELAVKNVMTVTGTVTNVDAWTAGAAVAPFREDRSSYPPVPQLPHMGTDYTEPQIYWIVKHGVRMTAMSAYGPFYSEKELWPIAAFIHQIRAFPPGVQERILT